MYLHGVTAVLLGINSIADLRKREILLWPTLLFWGVGVTVQLACGKLLPEILLSLLPGLCLTGISVAARGQIGMGDALVVCAACSWSGAVRILCSVFAALLLAPAAAVVLRMAGRPQKELPFVPFLGAGFLLSLLLAGR